MQYVIHFISLWLYGRTICRKKGEMFAKITDGTRYFRGPFPFFGKYFPHIDHKLMK